MGNLFCLLLFCRRVTRTFVAVVNLTVTSLSSVHDDLANGYRRAIHSTPL
jgi:hypothetical protein